MYIHNNPHHKVGYIQYMIYIPSLYLVIYPYSVAGDE